jgi:hypothetical protein
VIPTVDDLKSSPLTHRFGDLFNPPGLSNFLGCVQVDVDPVAIRSFSFPPFAMGDNVTAALFLNGKFFPAHGKAVTFTWRPDRIERVVEDIDGGLRLSSVTVMAVGKMAVVVRLKVENRSGTTRPIRLKLGLRGGITKSITPWSNAVPPVEPDNLVEVDPSRGALRFTAKNSAAVLIQGSRAAKSVTPVGIRFEFDLKSGESKEIDFVAAVSENASGASELYDSLIDHVGETIAHAERDWNEELRAIFTPGNDRYSGHLPTLETSDADVARVYNMGALGIAYFKRETPYSVHGRVYGTLLPRYWQTVTFLWDYSLSSVVHALLDPKVMRESLARWMKLDVHKHFGTEFLTGAGVGPWYAVNDFAMSVIARDYLRYNGDFGLLNERIGEKSGADYLSSYAQNYKQFQTASGLSDYGGLNNLLECVNTYLHEVASLNAANVFNLRFAAELAEMRGAAESASKMRESASALAAKVNELYVKGRGFWHARFPDGSLREVRHVYDFITVLNTMSDHLSDSQKREMVDFFRRELMTPTWLHALSPDDDDSLFSVRPDHQWNGAYPAWPPQAVMGLYKIGQVDLAFDWLKGLAKSANQGPYGQAHFVESVVASDAGGAIKAPSDFPWINDWTCSSVGSWSAIIIESIFGVQAGLKSIDAKPQFGKFDRNAVLKNLRWQGKNYTVTRDGLV